MKSTETQHELDQVFSALANRHRRAIIYTLGLQPTSISRLAEQQKLSLPAIYKHVKVLERAELLQRRKHGRTNFLALDRTKLIELQNWLMQYHAYWGNNSESLDNYIAALSQNDK